jgi:hypothetical protein
MFPLHSGQSGHPMPESLTRTWLPKMIRAYAATALLMARAGSHLLERRLG